MRYSVVLIDLDDTLLDFGAAARFSLHRLTEGYRRPISPREAEDFESINAECWRMLERGELTRDQLSRRRFDIFFEKIGIKADPLEANARFRAGLADSAVLIPGALELCRGLHEMCGLYLISNGFVDTQKKRISAAGLDRYFHGVFTSQGVGYTKPDPLFFRAVFDSIGHEKESETVVLGDSLTSDMAGGHAHGLDTCWFDPKGLPKPDTCTYSITSLDRFIPDILLG